MGGGTQISDEAVAHFELAQDETIVFACRPAKLPRLALYIVTLGLYEFWRRASFYVVTDRRCAERAGRITGTEVSLPLFYVQDAAIRTFLGWGYVSVTTAGGDSGGLATRWISKDDAVKFRRSILEQAHAIQPVRN